MLIFLELESSVHAVSKTIEGKWGKSASNSLKDYGRLLVPFLFLHKKGCVSRFLQIMLFRPILVIIFSWWKIKAKIQKV